MKFGQVKTLFIISFLILNVFLAMQFLEKLDETNMEALTQTTFEERLQAEEITMGELPESGRTEVYVSAEQYALTDEDREFLEDSLDNQNIAVINNQIIISEFIEPLPLDMENGELISALESSIIYVEDYQLWDYDEENNILIFFQRQNDRTILFNQAGVLIVRLNEDEEAVSYYQTILDEVTVQSEEQTVVDPINAIEAVFSSNTTPLQPEDHLSEMWLAYHSLLPLDGVTQVFTPTWIISINDGERYAFVNAMEGQVISNDRETFINDILTYMDQQIEQLIRGDTD